MGRFDALTRLEEETSTNAPSPVAPSPAPKKPSPKQITKQHDEEKKPEIMISGNHDTLPPVDNFKEKPLKYSTLLDAALIKRIKLFAAEKEIKDYKVIEIALTEYFDKHSNS